MKPQGIIFLPIILIEIIRRRKAGCIIPSVLWAFVTFVLVILPFSIKSGFSWIIRIYLNAIAEYPFASINAFNLPAYLGANYKYSALVPFLFSWQMWGTLAIISIVAFIGYLYMRGDRTKMMFPAALVLMSGVFTLSTGMHERYLMPVLILALLAYVRIKDERLLLLFGVYTITVFINMHPLLFDNIKYGFGLYEPGNLLLILVSLINVLMFAAVVAVSIKVFITKKL